MLYLLIFIWGICIFFNIIFLRLLLLIIFILDRLCMISLVGSDWNRNRFWWRSRDHFGMKWLVLFLLDLWGHWIRFNCPWLILFRERSIFLWACCIIIVIVMILTMLFSFFIRFHRIISILSRILIVFIWVCTVILRVFLFSEVVLHIFMLLLMICCLYAVPFC